jgi:predicted enzyme related to lactoylglutathione lyase
MKRVTGLGGIFFKAKDPKALAKWYDENLGIPFGKNLYNSFSWRENDVPSSLGRTEFGIFADNTEYFNPSEKQLMLNFRVDNLELLLQALKEEGANVQDKIDRYGYGNFGWVMDPEGNKIELWEPLESGFGEEENAVIERMKSMSRVTGIGGIFFKASNQLKLMDWYQKHLGINFSDAAKSFNWCEVYDKSKMGTTVFSIFKDTTRYFDPSKKDFMINLRVNNLDSLLNDLEKKGIKRVTDIEKYDYGNFGWIMDPEGNKIELWEAIDEKLK